MVLYEKVARPALFRVAGRDPEKAHDLTLAWLRWLARKGAITAPMRRRFEVSVPTTVFGISFGNPVGFAAGLDKDGEALRAWESFGFGFLEVGTVTWKPQHGNPRPRLFRLEASEAVINRMGFANRGAQALAVRLSGTRPRVPLGISLGKSSDTALADAAEDYCSSLRVLHGYGDYFAINVSSPNTPGLRSLQDGVELDALLAALQSQMRLLGPKPLLVKIAPDLSDAAIVDILTVCHRHEVAGIIATNTTVARDGIDRRDRAKATELGGLSGRPLTLRTREVVSFIHGETGGRIPIVGVGGILDPDDALALMDAGASLVQVLTGLIYRGPGLVRRINMALKAHDSDRSLQPGLSGL